ncbi:MAG: beta-galactosidase [Victivallales bacterium]
MKSEIVAVLFLSAILSPLAFMAMAGGGGKLDGSYLRDVTMKVETPHLEWAKPLAGGPVRALLLSPRNIAARELVELAQRLDLDFEAFVSFRACAPLAQDNMYDGAVEGTTTAEKEAELLRKLDRKYEVIVLGNCDLNMLPPEAKYRILSQVADGTGLVIVHPRDIPYKKLFAQPADGAGEILSMAEKSGLSEKASAVPEDKLLQCFRFGKGRIARIDYRTWHGAHYGGLSLTPLSAYSATWMSRYENCLVLVARSAMWAAGRSPTMKFVKPPFEPGKEYDAGALSRTPAAFELRGVQGGKGKLLLRIRDEWNKAEGSWEIPVAFEQTEASVKFTPPFLKAGIHFLDARLLTEKGVEDFGYRVFTVVSPVGKLELMSGRDSFEKGEKVCATLHLEKPLADDARVAVALSDSPYGRIWARKELPLKSGQNELSIGLEVIPLPTIAGYLSAEVLAKEGVLAKVQKILFFPERSLALFPTIAWDSVTEILSPMFAAQIVEALGWRAGLTHPSPEAGNATAAAIFDQRFVPYMTRIALNPDKDKPDWTKGAWYFPTDDRKKDIEALRGDESIYNPAAREIGRSCFLQRMRNLPKLGPAIYSLGDENGFSYGIGYSPSEDKEFRSFLEKRYVKIDALNREWGTSYASFDKVENQTEKEMKDTGRFAAWFDHCAFVEKEYADTHHLLSKWIKEADPHALVGAEGSQPGDLERTIDGLEFWGPYSDPVMDEVLRSVGGDRIRTLWWGGYVGSHGGRSIYPMPLWRPLLAGTVNGSSWFATSVSAEGMLAVDFSYAAYFEQLKPRLMKLQNGLAQLLITAPMERNGIAIRWCHMSSRAALLDERFASPVDSASCIQDFCYRNGFSFDYVTPTGIKAGKLDGVKILFLCGASVIDDAEADVLRGFVKKGGILVADLNPGLLNGFGRPTVEKGQLSDLFPGEVFAKKNKPELKAVSASGTLRGKALRLDAAKVFTSTEAPVFQVKELGGGSACLLNFAMSSARGTASAETPFDVFFRDLLAAAGVKSRVAVEGLNAGRVMVRLRNAPGGVVLGLLTDPKDVGRQFTVKLPKESFIYRADGGFLSKGGAISDTLDEPFKVYFLADKKMTAPKLALSASKTELGGAVTFDLSTLTTGGVYRIEVMRPDGKPYRLAMKVLVADGKQKTEPVRFAFNDQAGKYIVKLTDIRTGLFATSEIAVK